MDSSLYDEFGNYIGPDLGEDEDEDEESEDGLQDDWGDVKTGADGGAVAGSTDGGVVMGGSAAANGSASMDAEAEESGGDGGDSDDNDIGDGQAVVLHEDKVYFPNATEVYPEAEVLIEDEDTQPLETPIIAPVKDKQFMRVETELPRTTFDFKFLAGLMDHPGFIRNIALIGNLHHGKTSLVDMLVRETHMLDWSSGKNERYADARLDEQRRRLSIKATPMSIVLQSLRGKSYLLNVMDAPGHVNFSDEQTAALRVADGAVVVVDALEGVMAQTARGLRHAARAGLPICVCINKMDRLILELKLPPADAYHKVCHTLGEINQVLSRCGYGRRISPELGNVCFASAAYGWVFSLESFSRIYADYHGNFSAESFARRLWGDVYLDPKTRTFKQKPTGAGSQRTFVEFILEPLYKIHSHILGSEGKALRSVLAEAGVEVRSEDLKMDPKPLLRMCLTQFFGSCAGFVSMCVAQFPSPAAAAPDKVRATYTGGLGTAAGRAMLACDRRGPLMVNIVKLYSRPDGEKFDAFGRIMSGTARVGSRVRVLGEAYSLEDDEDMTVAEITKLWVSEGRYRVEVNRVTAGNWALIQGVDKSILKTATLCDEKGNADAQIFRPLVFNLESTIKVAIEPIKPSELPKMLDALRKVNKSYPLARTKVEDSGEHTLIGTGELYLDCMLHDLRRMYGELEIRVADPVATFCETVIETSTLRCFAETPNKKNKITMIAEPLDAGIAKDIESGVVRPLWDAKTMESHFTKEYGWDILSARSIWAFGPGAGGPNMLLDETLSYEVDKTRLSSVRQGIVQGFQWGTREGPLCNEPIRNVSFKLLGAEVAADAIHRGGGQVIPTARRVAYSAFLLATPRLMEPVNFVEIQCPADCVAAIHDVLARRRGHVTASLAKAGTPLYTVHASIPVIDSFGFETDLRTYTEGKAFSQSFFDRWDVVPGDPLDKSIVLRPLEPSPIEALAREFMVKTRRRKGLREDVSMNRFFDDRMLLELAKQDADLQDYFRDT